MANTCFSNLNSKIAQVAKEWAIPLLGEGGVGGGGV